MTRAIAVVLAGGRGTRMDILCHVRPKPALPFAGWYRVIDFTLSNCVHSQIADIAVMTDYQRSYMTSYLKLWNRTNASEKSFQILEPKAGSYQGTADAVYQNLDYLQKLSADTVLVLAGDHVYKMDYRKMLAFHEKVNADVTVGITGVPMEEAYRFGTVTLDAENRIVSFDEKSLTPISCLASMGIYAFKKEVLCRRLIEDAEKPESPHDFGYAVLPGMVNQDQVFAYRFDGYWQDIGTVEAYYTANMELLSQRPSFSLDSAWPVLTQNTGSAMIKKANQGKMINSIISPGCTIKGHVENSILSPGVWVDEEAEIRNSILMPNVFVGYHSVVDRCILDEGVNVGKACYIGFGKSLLPRDWDITVLGKGVSVPSHAAIGRNCIILPHTDASSFKGSIVSSGSIVTPSSVRQKLQTNPEAGIDERESIRVA